MAPREIADLQTPNFVYENKIAADLEAERWLPSSLRQCPRSTSPSRCPTHRGFAERTLLSTEASGRNTS